MASPLKYLGFKRILVLSLAGIGDTLMATPLLRALRLLYPDSEIHVLVLWPGSAALLEGNPHITQVHQHHFINAPKLDSLKFLLRLRRLKFDASLNTHPQGRHEYRAIARIIGASKRLSHSYENHGWLDRRLVTHTIPQDYSMGCVDNNLGLLTLLNPEADQGPWSRDYELHLQPSEHEWANQFISQNHLNSVPWLGIHVGSGGTKNLALRRWPIDCHIDLIQRLAKVRPNLRVVAFGGPDEAAAHAQLTRPLPPANLLIATTPGLRHAAALLRHANGFLSVDTAFMHLAAWARVPHQWVIETPTLTPTVYPPRPDWIKIHNPGIQGRHLDFYRYDGRPIAGSAESLEALMRQVTPETVCTEIVRHI